MRADEFLRGRYPYLFNQDDARYALPEALRFALATAFDHRPPCLPEAKANEAQAHYAAHILLSGNAARSNPSAPVPAGRVVEVKEGDVSVKYAEGAAGKSPTGAVTPYEAYKALADLCGYGAIITGADECERYKRRPRRDYAA